MVREFSEKEKKIEPGFPAFSLYGLSLTESAEKPLSTKTNVPLLTQLDQYQVQVTLPNNDCWKFELDKPVDIEPGEWSTDFLDCGLKSFTDPKGAIWQKNGNKWISDTDSTSRVWRGSVRNFKTNAERDLEGTSIYFKGKDGLQVEITDKGTEDYNFDPSNTGFKKELLELLPKYDLNHNGAWDRSELDTALSSAKGSAAVKLAALDENFSDIASLDLKASDNQTKVTEKALNKLDRRVESLSNHNFAGKHDSDWKIANRLADSLRNGYLDLIGSSADKTIQELRQETAVEIAKLHQQYKIDVAAPGDRPYIQSSFITSDNTTAHISGSRTPRFYEVRLFEEAIRQSEPNNLTKDGSQAVKLYFLNDTDWSGVAAFWSASDKSERPFITVQPSRVSRNLDELKRIYMHEMAHNGQLNSGWYHSSVFDRPEVSIEINSHNLDFLSNYDHKRQHLLILDNDLLSNGEHVEKISSPSGEHGKLMATAMGWQLNTDGTVLGLKGIDGRVYAPTKYDSAVDWHTVNEKFPCLKRTLTSNAMQKMALLGTVSDYFPDPKEMHAEALMLFRDHGKSELSPAMLQVIQADDQEQINQYYGLAKNGQPNRVRNEDGILIDNPAGNTTANSDTRSQSK